MSSLSRRNFLYGGGAAAAGAAALTTTGGSPAVAASVVGAPTLADALLVPEGEDHLVVYVSNTGAAEVMVMTDGHEVVFNDPELVARVQRAAKRASV